MKNTLAGLTLAALLALSGTLSAQEMPLWEGKVRTAEQLEADKRFVDGVTAAVRGDLKAAYAGALDRGWRAFAQKDYETAIRRFNQAHLIDPRRGEAYWGFALSTALRGDGVDIAERWFTEAEKRIGNASPLHSDHGRILDQNGLPQRAKAQFEIALEKDPNNVEAHIGMARVSSQLGDRATADKHLKEIERLKPR